MSCIHEILFHLLRLVLNTGRSTGFPPPPGSGAVGAAWHIPLSYCSPPQPHLCLSWCHFSSHQRLPLLWAILRGFFWVPYKQREKLGTSGGCRMNTYNISACAKSFPIFLRLFQRRIVTRLYPPVALPAFLLEAHFSRLYRTGLTLLEASLLKILPSQCDISRFNVMVLQCKF